MQIPSNTSTVARAADGRYVQSLHVANSRLAWALLAVTALAPLPFGSARPFFWAVLAATIGVIGLVYLLAGKREQRAMILPAYSALLYGAFISCLVVQLMPLGALGPAVMTRAGVAVTTQTLSLDPGSTFLTLLRWATYGCVALLFIQVSANRARAFWLLEVLFFVVAAYGLYGLVALTQLGDSILIFDKWTYQGMATGPFINRNSFATFLAFGVVMGIALLAAELSRRLEARRTGERGDRRRSVPIYIAGLAVLLAALLATQSRMGIAAALAGAAVVLCLSLIRARLGGLAIAIGIASFAGAATGIALLYGGGLTDRLGAIDAALDVRLDLYSQILDMIWARPWLGYGGGTFEVAFPLFQVLPVSPDVVWSKAHNTYLALWSEMGVVVGSLPLLMVALLAMAAMKNWAREREWAIGACAIGVAVTAAVHSLVDFSLEIEAVTILFVAVLAIGSATKREAR